MCAASGMANLRRRQCHGRYPHPSPPPLRVLAHPAREGHIGGFYRFSARSAVCHLHTLEPRCVCKREPARTSCAPPVTPPRPSPTGGGGISAVFVASAREAPYVIYIHLSAQCVCKCESARTSCAPSVTPPRPHRGGGISVVFCHFSARSTVCHLHTLERSMCM